MTLSVQVDLADESNSSEMRLFRIAISGFPTDCCPSTWRLDPGLPGWSSVLRGGCPTISGSSAAFFGSCRDHPFPPPSPLSFFLSSVSLCPTPPVFSNRGPAWQTGTRPFRRPFASSPYLSLFSSSAVPLLLISLLLLLAGIHPHPGPYQLRSRDIERTRHRPSP